MKKKPLKQTLSSIHDHYPVVIIGGGIVGAGVFRDLALNKVSTLIIDKHDFTSQTSQSSSKMLHGGIRYLENMDFKLVKEALHEKNLWLKLTPHLAQERRFYLPVYQDSLRPLWQIKIGLFLYDLLSLFLNTLHGTATKEESIKVFPELKKNGLTGAGYYYDAVVDDAKLTLECLYDGLQEKNCHALNYVALEDVQVLPNGYQVTMKDQLTNVQRIINCDQLIFATGPFTDKLLSNLSYLKWHNKLIPSKGSHLWLAPTSLTIKDPLVLTPKDGRVIFVIPYQHAILVGTTECNEEVTANQKPSQSEIDYLLQNINDYFTGTTVTPDHIIGMFAGTRPLVKDPDAANDRGKTAREHQIYQPHPHTFVMIGGKYTTFRVMAAELTGLVMRQRKKPYDASKSLKPLRQRSRGLDTDSSQLSQDDINYFIDYELARTQEDIKDRRLGIGHEGKNLDLSHFKMPLY
jgi:glycerol-3-phosphate dehydrogenase